mmetsp:Transcript_35231/g.67338  ORF Transcript_35231/g.67338 Transcript_35231/m.67338 type:complete len:249 (+) Transcript_35231:2203-2949(+)
MLMTASWSLSKVCWMSLQSCLPSFKVVENCLARLRTCMNPEVISVASLEVLGCGGLKSTAALSRARALFVCGRRGELLFSAKLEGELCCCLERSRNGDTCRAGSGLGLRARGAGGEPRALRLPRNFARRGLLGLTLRLFLARSSCNASWNPMPDAHGTFWRSSPSCTSSSALLRLRLRLWGLAEENPRAGLPSLLELRERRPRSPSLAWQNGPRRADSRGQRLTESLFRVAPPLLRLWASIPPPLTTN